MTNIETAETPASVAHQARHDGSEKATAGKRTTRKSTATQRKRAAKSAKPKKAAAAKRKTDHPGRSKADVILSLLRRPKGVTLATIMAATGWQSHSIRGFLSLARCRRGLKVTSAKNAAGERVYRVAK